MFVKAHLRRPENYLRARGEVDHIEIVVNRDLKSGKLDVIPLSEMEVIELIADLSRSLAILRRL